MRDELEPTTGSVSASERGVTVEVDGTVVRFDAAGRLRRLFDGTDSIQRGADGTTYRKRWVSTTVDGEKVRVRRAREVVEPERTELFERAYDIAHAVLDRRTTAPPRTAEEVSDCETFDADPAARKSIERVLSTTPADLDRHAAGFSAVYDRVSVLPPDGYSALVLQSVVGCPYDCSFCTLYRDREVSVRSPEAFAEHVRAVKSYFGRGIRSRRGIFLGDADPLAAPRETLVAHFETIEAELPDRLAEGLSAFCTARTAARRSPDTLEALADRGLERVHVGVESGDPEVLDVLEKPQTPKTVRGGVENLKRAGLDVGLIVLAGPGGERLADAHLRSTVDHVASLSLTDDDFVYVSPLAVDPDSRYRQRAREEALGSPSDATVALEASRLRDRLDEVTPARVTTYHVAGFVYV